METYRVWVPIEDDLIKSVDVDEKTGDYIVSGVMSADHKDEEGDVISPEGMDCSYFLSKGWIKYEHGNDPDQFIGEPLEVKVGQFAHPTTQESVHGVYVKARLFKAREKTKQAVRAIQDLQKSSTKRVMGWSIEGGVVQRDPKTNKIVKSILRNVVLTMNPVNTMTWAELQKSFAPNHALTIDMTEKSMDTGAMAEMTPQSVEGKPKNVTRPEPEEEPELSLDAWKDLLAGFIGEQASDEETKKSFMTAKRGTVADLAYTYVAGLGGSQAMATQFACYLVKSHHKIRLLVKSYGGENGMKDAFAQLDDAVELLQKSLTPDSEEDGYDDEEELQKSVGDDEEEDDEADDEDDEEEDGEDDGEQEGFAKSFGASEIGQQAFEVSEFLRDLVDDVGASLDVVHKSLTDVTANQDKTAKALVSVLQLTKSLADRVEVLTGDNEELQKSLNAILGRPVGRRSVTSGREVQTLKKGMPAGSAPSNTQLTRGQVMDELFKSLEAAEEGADDNLTKSIGRQISRYESGVPLAKLDLPANLRTKFGL